jgi:hypothetical protein
MKGSDIEVLASRTRLEFIVVQPPDGMEMTWINSVTVPKPYRCVGGVCRHCGGSQVSAMSGG